MKIEEAVPKPWPGWESIFYLANVAKVAKVLQLHSKSFNLPQKLPGAIHNQDSAHCDP